jgi:HEAT repeat protein
MSRTRRLNIPLFITTLVTTATVLVQNFGRSVVEAAIVQNATNIETAEPAEEPPEVQAPEDKPWPVVLEAARLDGHWFQLAATLQLAKVPADDEALVDQAIEVLLDHLRPGGDETIEGAAAIAIKELGAASLPLIRARLEDDDWLNVATACNAIKALGHAAIEFMPELIGFLETQEAPQQRASLYALQGFGADAIEAIDSVIPCLASSDFNVQCMACRVLEPMGPDAIEAEKLLLEILATGNPSSRGWSAIVLGAIGPTDSADIVPLLVGKLQESRAFVEKQRILIGLAYLGRDAQRAVEPIEAYLDQRKHRVETHAAYALYRITGKQSYLTELVADALSDRNQQHDAFEIVRRLETEALPLKDAIVEQLSANGEDVRELAVLALGRLGSSARDTIPDLKKRLLDSDTLVRLAAVDAIKAIKLEENDSRTP